uniref:Uncharacterized protein n=1 Tax=Streptomyces sp. KIB-H033 TaxID=1912612 RepID=A0A1I9S3S4_9ACTN|nr:hypothetical protein [Streptomyces sp. KIB-H033]
MQFGHAPACVGRRGPLRRAGRRGSLPPWCRDGCRHRIPPPRGPAVPWNRCADRARVLGRGYVRHPTACVAQLGKHRRSR